MCYYFILFYFIELHYITLNAPALGDALRAKKAGPPSFGATTTRQISQKWKSVGKCHWRSIGTIPVNIHWTSGNPVEHTTDKLNFPGKCHWKSIWKCHWKSIWKCHWKSTMISEASISGVLSSAPILAVCLGAVAGAPEWLPHAVRSTGVLHHSTVHTDAFPSGIIP